MNCSPSLVVQGDRTMDELTLLTVNNGGTDADLPANNLTYTLTEAPAGAAIDAADSITWTPTESQGPGVFTFTTRVDDNGTPNLFATNTFTVTVNEVNTAPSLGALSNFAVDAGQNVSFTASSTDADAPANTLTYSLVSPPSGASIDPVTGVFFWIADATNSIQVRVTDNGTPPLDDTKSFTVTVNEPPSGVVEIRNFRIENNIVRFEVHGPPGNYTVLSSVDLKEWSSLVRKGVTVPPFNVEDTGSSDYPRRFYKVVKNP